jgi:ADP-ribose pyrophosphatase YjhB (NUDIX family)/catechol 2,3-dioxygenase-like lactoylglutathione lyase family enzyme
MTKHTSEIFVTVDAVVFGLGANDVLLLLIQRKNEPFKGQWALPGGFVEKHEDLQTAAKRELEEETGLKVDSMEQLHAFGKPGRDPRDRMISVAYAATVQLAETTINAADDAADTKWFNINQLPTLAFDHSEAIQMAIANLKPSNNLTFTHVKETCLYVTDLARTRAFYEGKIGLECIGEVPNRHIFFRAGSSVLLCFIAEATKNDQSLPPHFGYGQQHFAFECKKEDYQSWRNKLVNAGITIIQDVEWPRGGRSFYFHDPDLNLAEIVEPGIWDS